MEQVAFATMELPQRTERNAEGKDDISSAFLGVLCGNSCRHLRFTGENPRKTGEATPPVN